MRILHIYKDYYPVLGGIENHVRMLAEAQAARGHDVTVLITSMNRASRVSNLNGVRVLYAARLLNVSSAPLSLAMFQNVAQIETDVAHLHSPYPFGEVANYLFGRAHATVLTYHSDIVRQKIMGAFYTPILNRVLARVDAIIATSPNYILSSPILRQWQDKCVVIPLASPVAPAPQNEPAQNLPPGTNLSNQSLLFVGKLRYYKGVNYLLQALALLPTARLTIVGTGPMEHLWKELADALGIASRVTWVGQVSDDELRGYYRACDVFVLPCSERSEAFGMVQLEAMAAGKPVVSCDVNTGVAWVNQNEITGLVVPPGDPRALADALARLMADPGRRRRMGQAGQARVAQEFTLDKMVERVTQVYSTALS